MDTGCTMTNKFTFSIKTSNVNHFEELDIHLENPSFKLYLDICDLINDYYAEQQERDK